MACAKDDFFQELLEKKAVIAAIVQSQLGAPSCRIAHHDAWGWGGSHVAIPCLITPDWSVYFRLPIPNAVGEDGNPGNAHECLSTQVASYLWIAANCPNVPIPTLYSFGLADGSVFTHPERTPFWERLRWRVQRWIRLLVGAATPVGHVLRTDRHQLGRGFLIISAAQGDSLVLSWAKRRSDATYRQNLFRGLARAQLSLASVPMPRIGSLTLQTDGSISLTNRPLTPYVLDSEMRGVASTIPRRRTYGASLVYIAGLLSLQDSLLRGQRGAMESVQDGQRQLAALTMLRATAHLFLSDELREGPFPVMLTEMHMPNIFTDELGNVRTIIDVETAALPAEMQPPPRWLLLDDEETSSDMSCREMLDEYLAIFANEKEKTKWEEEEAEETRCRVGFEAKDNKLCSRLSIETATQRAYFFAAVTMPGAMYHLFNRHIQPLFHTEHPSLSQFDEAVHHYWSVGAEAFVHQKIQEQKDANG